jgi:hypothetical protein
MKCYLPWLGEFGNEVLRWVPTIYSDPAEKIVCYEAGKDCLYPRATVRHIVPRIDVRQRACSGSLNQDEIWAVIRKQYGPDHDYIVPHSTIPLYNHLEIFAPATRDFGFDCDVAVFPRWRKQGPYKNWEHWPAVINELMSRGLSVFACGHADSSYAVDCPAAWDYDESLEASVWAIQHSTVRIGPSTSLTSLSHYCGQTPWVLFQGEGSAQEIIRSLPNLSYAKFADRRGAGTRLIPYWNNPEKVMEELCTVFK